MNDSLRSEILKVFNVKSIIYNTIQLTALWYYVKILVDEDSTEASTIGLWKQVNMLDFKALYKLFILQILSLPI